MLWTCFRASWGKTIFGKKIIVSLFFGENDFFSASENDFTPSCQNLKFVFFSQDFPRFFLAPLLPRKKSLIFFLPKNRFPPTSPKTYPKHSSRLLLSSENEPFKECTQNQPFLERKKCLMGVIKFAAGLIYPGVYIPTHHCKLIHERSTHTLRQSKV